MLSQVDVLQNSRQNIGNTYNDFQLLVSIIFKRFDNIQINESNDYLKKIKEEHQDEISEMKSNELLTSHKETIKVKKTNNKYIIKLKPYINQAIL